MSAPQRVVVIGAGMVGLSTAWHLLHQGVEVTVLDRTGVAAGASWGNAGWLTPSIATPLPEPAILKYGARAVLSAHSPVYVPPRLNADLGRFVLGFTRNSTAKRWTRAMRALLPLNRRALGAFAHLTDNGVAAQVRPADPFLAAYSDVGSMKVLIEEFADIKAAGGNVDYDLISGEEARDKEAALSERVNGAVLIHGQRFIDPGAFVAALGESVQDLGGVIRSGVTVDSVREGTSGTVSLTDSAGQREQFDAAVIATGTWLRTLARAVGVKHLVQAGRGYSFSIPVQHLPTGPVYFPEKRVAMTPLGDRLRVAGMMEFRRPEDPLDPRRVTAIVNASRPLLSGADFDDRQDEWVGSRPVTADGLPLIGRTSSERIFVAGGHGMWGITLGPVTGELLAEQIITGHAPRELAPFDPLRSTAPART